jgi:hypothetical protein
LQKERFIEEEKRKDPVLVIAWRQDDKYMIWLNCVQHLYFLFLSPMGRT